MSGIRSVKQLTHNSHLNFFEMEAEDRKGHLFPYYAASRAVNTEALRMNCPGRAADGVTVCSTYGEGRDRVVLIRQYRYPVGGFVYEFPAGLLEAGEDARECAVREMKEETGLDLAVTDADPMYERPFFTTDGMTDEACSIVFGHCTGEVSLRGLEDSETLEVVLADRGEARRILREEPVALMCAYMLMVFVWSGEGPFLPPVLRQNGAGGELPGDAGERRDGDGREPGQDNTVLVESAGAEETFALGKRLGETARPGQVIALSGDLGTGKTVFCQGFAEGLGVSEYVNSPTFTILQVYEDGRLPLYHFDVYRIEEWEEMDEIGSEEYFYGEGVCLIEWAERIEGLLPPGCLRVRIEKEPEKGFDYRRISLTGFPER